MYSVLCKKVLCCVKANIQDDCNASADCKLLKDCNLSDQLIHAVKNRRSPSASIGDIKALIDLGADINRLYEGTLPLHCVNDVCCLRFLLEKGAMVNAVDDHGQTALQCVTERKGFEFCVDEFVEVLIQQGADINKSDGHTKTPLYWAVYTNKIECIKLLLQHGADVNINYYTPLDISMSPLHCAVTFDRMECFKLLLQYGADVNLGAGTNRTPLHWAASVAVYVDSLEYVKILLQHGADINVCDRLKHTPLYFAVRTNNVECVELMLQRGANVDGDGRCSETPLLKAVEDNGEFTKSLFQNDTNNPYKKQLILKAEENNAQCVKRLLHHGADVNADNSKSLLFMAVKHNNVETVKLLLQHGANVNFCTMHNYTPLYMAVCLNNVECVKLLLQYKADVDIQNDLHLTALSCAAYYSKLQILKILLDYNCNVNIQMLLMPSARDNLFNTNRNLGEASLDLLIKATGQFDLRDETGELIPDIACDDELREMLLSYCVEPRSLQELCRHQIRLSLRNRFLPNIVPLLNLPASLQGFVLLQR